MIVNAIDLKFKDIFDIKKNIIKKPLYTDNGDVPFIGASDKNNGTTEYYSYKDIESSSKTVKSLNHHINQRLFKSHTFCVTNNGPVGYAFYQVKEFICSHDVNLLYLREGDFNRYTGLFIATVIIKDRCRCDY